MSSVSPTTIWVLTFSDIDDDYKHRSSDSVHTQLFSSKEVAERALCSKLYPLIVEQWIEKSSYRGSNRESMCKRHPGTRGYLNDTRGKFLSFRYNLSVLELMAGELLVGEYVPMRYEWSIEPVQVRTTEPTQFGPGEDPENEFEEEWPEDESDSEEENETPDNKRKHEDETEDTNKKQKTTD